MKNISIIGASGFIGKNLIDFFLENTDHYINAISLHPERVVVDSKYLNRIKFSKTDVFDFNNVKIALIGTDIAFYLVHMLDCNGNFCNKENEAAENVGKALKDNNVGKVIYMSGLGSDKDELSEHLKSRHNTGKILSKYLPTVEFRASMIIGKGSASFEIIRDIISRAPILLVPNKSMTKTQPITKKDAILYLSSAMNSQINESVIIEIGGPEVITYKAFLEKYNTWSKRNIPIIKITFLSCKVAGFFLSFFTSEKQSKIGQNMISSFNNEMIVTNNKAQEIFPEIKTERVENGFI